MGIGCNLGKGGTHHAMRFICSQWNTEPYKIGEITDIYFLMYQILSCGNAIYCLSWNIPLHCVMIRHCGWFDKML